MKTLLNVAQCLTALGTVLPVLAVVAGHVLPGLGFLVDGGNEAALMVAAAGSMLVYAVLIRLGVDHRTEGGEGR